MVILCATSIWYNIQKRRRKYLVWAIGKIIRVSSILPFMVEPLLSCTLYHGNRFSHHYELHRLWGMIFLVSWCAEMSKPIHRVRGCKWLWALICPTVHMKCCWCFSWDMLHIHLPFVLSRGGNGKPQRLWHHINYSLHALGGPTKRS